MSLITQLQQDQLQARKDKDQKRLSILQVVLSEIKNEQIKLGKELQDEQAQSVVASQVKKLRDGLKDFESAGRSDLAEEAQAEISVLESYLPEQLDDSELRSIIESTITELGASTAAEMGKVMSAAMPKVSGRADGNRVRALVQELLK